MLVFTRDYLGCVTIVEHLVAVHSPLSYHAVVKVTGSNHSQLKLLTNFGDIMRG